jgi:Zn-dependent peptidase ImmA (M78 family)
MPSREWYRLDHEAKAVIIGHQNEMPVPLARLARAFGVSVKAATLAPGISGELRPNPDGSFVIRVNRHDAPARQRFTVAHELAHFLLHRPLIGHGIEDDVLYRSALSDQIEAEANRLAADILMPLEQVQEEYRAACGNGVDVVGMLAARFGVSEPAMKIRLGL